LAPFGQAVSEEKIFFNIIPLKLLGKIEPNLAGSIYVRSSVKLLHLVPFGQQTWPPRLILFSDQSSNHMGLLRLLLSLDYSKLETQPTEPVTLT
jgi:hypothetical protein